ncbi:MAG: peptidase T [Lachnospiraceae bacterium]|nr:peptidase T [Lachnospiraceae bacterium]
MKVEDRFLKYVSIWTTSCEDQDKIPSSEREFDLAHELEKEMKEMGLSKVKCDEHCYVYGLLPATKGYESKKSIGFIAHMDTAPAFSGKDINPTVIPDYDGKDVVLASTKEVLKVSDFPRLSSRVGQTLIVTDGTTLLGADDKAGVAEILTAVEQVIQHSIPHSDIWIGFTPDEEVGRGADLFDLDYFQADYAYTVDGDYEGEIAYENFNAASATFHIKGVNVHPGSAKNIMVNAASIACEIQSLLPSSETPEHTQGREGFYHLTNISGDVNAAQLSYIIRDHDKASYQKRMDFLRDVAELMKKKYSEEFISLDISESYHNMLEVIEKNFYIVDKAKDAIRSQGIEPISLPVRGGTDGARLSFQGLPCPNLGTGGEGFHGPYEHITVEAMEKAVAIIVEIMKNPI